VIFGVGVNPPRTSFRDSLSHANRYSTSGSHLSGMSNIMPVFVDGLNAEGLIRVGNSRVHHKKSRTGCQRCRSRRVKVRRTSSSSDSLLAIGLWRKQPILVLTDSFFIVQRSEAHLPQL
jgi:hypothetical protein